MGRPPLSDAEKKRRGTFQPCRSAAARAAKRAAAAVATPRPPAPSTPSPAPSRRRAPPPPSHLSSAARRVWSETARGIVAAGRRVDRAALELFATALVAFRAAAKTEPAGRLTLRWAREVERLRTTLGLDAASAAAVPPEPSPAPVPAPTEAAALPAGCDPATAALTAGAPIPQEVTREFLFGKRRLLYPLPPEAIGPPRLSVVPPATDPSTTSAQPAPEDRAGAAIGGQTGQDKGSLPGA